jgi:hypothetical protein
MPWQYSGGDKKSQSNQRDLESFDTRYTVVAGVTAAGTPILLARSVPVKRRIEHIFNWMKWKSAWC